MFRDLIKVKIDEARYLVNDRGIRYERPNPIQTIELDFLGFPFKYDTISDISEYSRIEKEIKRLIPEINAWMDAGISRTEEKAIELPDIDINGNIHREKREVIQTTRKIELYHLGE